MWIFSHAASTASIVVFTLSVFATSQANACATPPAAVISPTVAAKASALRARQATLAPERASPSAIDLPSPRDAPVNHGYLAFKVDSHLRLNRFRHESGLLCELRWSILREPIRME